MIMYALGLKNQDEFMSSMMSMLASGEELKNVDITKYSYEDILNMKFKLLLNYQYFVQDEETGLWTNYKDNAMYVKQLIETEGTDISIVGILRPDPHNVLSIGTGSIGFTDALMDFALEQTLNSAPVQAQLADKKTDIITGSEFSDLTVNDFSLADVDLSVIDFSLLNLQPFMSMLEDIDLSQIDILNFDITDFIDFTDMTTLQKRIVEGYLNDEQVLAIKQAYVDTLNRQCSLDNTYLVGMERAEAEKRLADEHLGFRWAKEGRYSPDVPAGHVLLQIPGPGREVKRGRTVFLTPSKGVREVAVPNLRGQSQRQASLSIQRLGLVRGPDVPGGHVSSPYNVIIRTIPGSGELVRVGDTVSLVVSRGMTAGRTVRPDVRKLPMDEAAAKLDELGFAVVKELSGTPSKDTSFAPGSVLEQRPMGGEYLPAGDTIHLVGAP